MQKPQIGVAVLAAALLAAPAAADWLVTREGGRVETRGPWKTKGKLLVFTRADGQLSSLRLADVDLAASERATAEAVAKAKEAAEVKQNPPPPAEKKESRWVMTDKDFKTYTPPVKDETPAAEETDAAGRPRVGVLLDTWERRDSQDGVEIIGTLRNSSEELAADVGVTVRLFDESGALIATGEGRIAAPSIAPGANADFKASFPGLFSFAEAKFEPRGFGLRLKGAPEAPEEEENP